MIKVRHLVFSFLGGIVTGYFLVILIVRLALSR